MDMSPIFQALKLGTKAYAVVALASGLILGLKTYYPNILKSFAVTDMVEKYQALLFFAFLVSSVALLVSLISAVFEFWVESWISRKLLKNRIELLHHLSVQEREFLSRYIENNMSTQRADYSDGIANGLQAKKIVFRTSAVSEPGGRVFPYNIQPWAMNYLQKHPELLQLDSID